MFSIWEQESFLAQQDVVVAGSGFAGLWSAYHLKKDHPKLKITVIERGLFPTGASTRNAGFASFGSLSELLYDAKSMGADKMLQLVEQRYKGLQQIRKVFKSKSIDMELCGGYELYGSESPKKSELKQQMEELNPLLKDITGKKTTFRLADKKIKDFRFAGTKHVVKNEQEGCLHSGKLVSGLLRAVQSMGVMVLNGLQVTEFHPGGENIEGRTAQGVSLKTHKLLICTNAFAKEMFPGLEVVAARGQVLLTSPIAGLQVKGTFHAEEGYYYFRNLGDRLMLGGARHKAFAEEATTDINTSPFIQEELERYLEEVVLPSYKGKYTIEQRWSGIMGMGPEKLPIIKQLAPNVFCAVALGGIGVAMAPVVGKRVSKLLVS